jgi:hypothetical protein
VVATHTAMVIEPASDWLVRTCNASLELAAAAAGTRCVFCRCCTGRAALSWQLRQEAELLALRLAGEPSSSTHRSPPHSHKPFPAPH